jgi:hypothetical protein
MAAPAAYSEATLKGLMHAMLGAVADSLGWSVAGGSYDEALNETLLAYGTDDVATVVGRENLLELRALARREVWRAVMAETSGDYDFQDEAGRNNRSQVFAMASKNYAQAAADALVYDPLYEIRIETMGFGDPYLPFKLEG